MDGSGPGNEKIYNSKFIIHNFYSMEKKNGGKKLSLREIYQKHEANMARIGEIADACELEQRERSAAETKEVEALMRECEVLRMRAVAESGSLPAAPREAVQERDRVLREAMGQTQPVEIRVVREIQTSDVLEGTGIIPVAEQEMLKPIRKGLIYDKVGINIRSGLAAGKLRWPMHTKAVASFAGEGERLTDSSIDFSKLEVKPERMGIAIPLTREELESSQGIVDSVVREEMPKAIVDLVNSAMFTTEGTFQASNGQGGQVTKTKKVVGPLVKAAERAVEFAGEVPTRKELLKMKAQVAAKVDLSAPCWVMTENMKAELEDVKVDAGSGRFVCENGMILGYPVFVTQEIGEGNVAFGDWSYQAAGFFGPMTMIVDPYTLARNNATDFVLNGHFATVTLREDAFVLGKSKA